MHILMMTQQNILSILLNFAMKLTQHSSNAYVKHFRNNKADELEMQTF